APLSFSDPNRATVGVQDAQNFVVSGITIVQGGARPGVLLGQSAIGQVSGVTFNAGLTGFDFGIIMGGCSNVSFIGNLFLNENTGMQLGGVTFVSQSIAVIGNTINAGNAGIIVSTGLNIVDVEQNQIQMLSGGSAITISGANNFFVLRNSTFSGGNGIS